MDTAIEVQISQGPESGSYIVRVLRSVGGEPVETITLDVGELASRRAHVEASILASSVSTRRIVSDNESAVQSMGVQLFEATFAGDIRTAYRPSAAVAAERGIEESASDILDGRLGVNDNDPEGNRGGFLALITHRPTG